MLKNYHIQVLSRAIFDILMGHATKQELNKLSAFHMHLITPATLVMSPVLAADVAKIKQIVSRVGYDLNNPDDAKKIFDKFGFEGVDRYESRTDLVNVLIGIQRIIYDSMDRIAEVRRFEKLLKESEQMLKDDDRKLMDALRHSRQAAA